MQMVKKILLFLVLIWLGIVLFMPKESLYFTLEKVLAKEGIEINESKIDEGLFTLTLEHPVLYMQGIPVAKIDHVHFFTLLFYTVAELDGVKVDSSLKNYFPEKVDTLEVTHLLLHPLTLSLSGKGDFGTVSGKIDLATHKVHIDVSEPKKLGALKRQLKKNKKGWYYETSF
jgi:hypothetical protein